MGTNECSQPASKSSWDSQDFGDVNMVLKMLHFHKSSRPQWVNSSSPRQNGRHFTDDIFKCIFLNENVWISIKISLKFVPKGPINNIPALVQIIARHRPGDKPLSVPMMVSLPKHIYVTWPQWVKVRLVGCSAVSHCLNQRWLRGYLERDFNEILINI